MAPREYIINCCTCGYGPFNLYDGIHVGCSGCGHLFCSTCRKEQPAPSYRGRYNGYGSPDTDDSNDEIIPDILGPSNLAGDVSIDLHAAQSTDLTLNLTGQKSGALFLNAPPAQEARLGAPASRLGLCDYSRVPWTDLSLTRKGSKIESLTSILRSRNLREPLRDRVISSQTSTSSGPAVPIVSNQPTPVSPTSTKQSPFTALWHSKVLPVLDQRLPDLIGSAFSIDVVRDLSSRLCPTHPFSLPDSKIPRVVHFSSPSGISVVHHVQIRALTVEALPEDYRSAMTCKFHVGSVTRCCDCAYCGKDSDRPDKSCDPKRIHYQTRPLMGVSIAVDDCRYQGTLGGYVLVNDQLYLGLTNNHIFEDDRVGRKVATTDRFGDIVRQPAESDSPGNFERFGKLDYASGDRRREPTGRTRSDGEEWVMMDWCTIRVDPGRAGANIIVKDEAIRNAFDAESFDPLRQIVQPNVPGLVACGGECKEIYAFQKVHTVGRTSGYQIAQVTEGKSSVHFNTNHITHEWGLYMDSKVHGQWEFNPLSDDINSEILTKLREKRLHEKWILEGPGQPGDSGSWVIDRATGALCGMIFARGPQYGEGDRVAYFSDIRDILADMKDTIAYHNRSQDLTPDDISIEVVKPKIWDLSGDIESSTMPKEKLQPGSSLQNKAIRVPAKHSLEPDEHDFLGLGRSDVRAHFGLPPELVGDLEDFKAESLGEVDPSSYITNVEGPSEKKEKEKKDMKPATLVHRSRAIAGVLTNNRQQAPASFSLVLPVR